MKNLIKFLQISLLLLAVTIPANAYAGDKATNAQRVKYVVKNLKLGKDVQAKIQPLLTSYLRDKDAAEAAYESLKDKYKSAIKSNKLSEQQAQQLLNAKWTAAEKELAVKRAYEKKFRTVLSAAKTYQCFDLLNDKNSKVLGY